MPHLRETTASTQDTTKCLLTRALENKDKNPRQHILTCFDIKLALQLTQQASFVLNGRVISVLVEIIYMSAHTT